MPVHSELSVLVRTANEALVCFGGSKWQVRVQVQVLTLQVQVRVQVLIANVSSTEVLRVGSTSGANVANLSHIELFEVGGTVANVSCVEEVT